MLNTKEEKLISENVKSFDHLIDCNSHIFGEPFLENDYLYYFDGKIATLITPRIKGVINNANANDTIKKIITKHDPENLLFWGEVPKLEIKKQKGYQLYNEELDQYKKEFVFKTNDFKSNPKYRRYLNMAEREGLTFNFVQLPYYKAEYTDILAKTHDDQIDIRSLSYYSIYPRAKGIKFFEVFKDKKLIAVHIVLEALPYYVCFAEIGYDKSFKNSSGISGTMLMKEYLDKAEYISLGGSANEGIYKYKQELVGDLRGGLEDHYIWCNFYKDKRDKKIRWWLERMKSE